MTVKLMRENSESGYCAPISSSGAKRLEHFAKRRRKGIRQHRIHGNEPLALGGELSNADLTLTLVVTSADATGANIEVTSLFPLGQATIGFANDDVDESPPSMLVLADAEGLIWRGHVSGQIDADTTMRVLVYASEAKFYAEVPITFFFAE